MKIIKISQEDWDVNLECICADDFGSGYKEKPTVEDRANIKRYNQTREAHQKLRSLAEEHDIRRYIADTDDRDSKHSDAYLYFPWSRINDVIAILKESGVSGDVLDVPDGFPPRLRAFAEKMGWTVEEGYEPS